MPNRKITRNTKKKKNPIPNLKEDQSNWPGTSKALHSTTPGSRSHHNTKLQYKTSPSIAPKRSINRTEIKRIYSPFCKFNIERPNNMTKTPVIIRRNGLSPKERSFIVCSCQAKTTRYINLKSKAAAAIKNKNIFSIYGNVAAIRKALVDRGWVEKIPPNRMNLTKLRERKLGGKTDMHAELERLLLSNLVEREQPNFIWGTKEEISDLTKYSNPEKIKCICNRLRLDAPWTTKQGLCKSLRENYWYFIEDVAELDAPRTYNNAEGEEKEDFIKDYKLTACTSLLKWVLSMVANERPIFAETGKISMNVLVFALNRCKEYLFEKQNRDIDCCETTSATSGQWNSFLKKYYILIAKEDVFQMDKDHKLPLYMGYAKFLLKEIIRHRPQLSCEGCHNIWIIKPAHCSRGRGIRMASKLGVINDLISKTASKYVVQKYIEEPLLIYETKFDIRQYYLITSTYPLEIWMYKDCYLKFSSQKYTIQDFHESIHLTNNAVQKKYKNCSGRHKDLPPHNMWDLDTYKEYLNKIGKEEVWENWIYPVMKKTIVGIMLSHQDSLSYSTNCFELYGCDFILDKDYRPWLIEINSSPDLNPTTQVTARICPEVLTDVIKVVIDHAANPKASTGKFECLYRQPTTSPRYGTGNDLIVVGHALPQNYFFRGYIEVKNNSYDSPTDKPQNISTILHKLKSIYEEDVMKVPDIEYELPGTKLYEKGSGHVELVDKMSSELPGIKLSEKGSDHVELVDKISSDSGSSKRLSQHAIDQNSSSLSSTNLIRKGYAMETQSATDLKSCLKKTISLLNLTTSADAAPKIASRIAFHFSKLEDQSGSEVSEYSELSKDRSDVAGTSSDSVDNENCNMIFMSTINETPLQDSQDYQNSQAEETSKPLTLTQKDSHKITVQEITKKIFNFLEQKENEYSKKP